MMSLARVISVFVLVFSSATIAAGQEPPGATVASTVTVGTRVRVLSTTMEARVRGVVVAVDETVITLALEGGLPLKVPLRSITEMDVSLGTKRNTLKGLAIGGLSGIALGFAFPVDPENCGPGSTNLCSRREGIVGGTFLFGALGTGIGALIKSQRWAPISVGLRPSGGAKRPAVEVAVAVRF